MHLVLIAHGRHRVGIGRGVLYAVSSIHHHAHIGVNLPIIALVLAVVVRAVAIHLHAVIAAIVLWLGLLRPAALRLLLLLRVVTAHCSIHVRRILDSYLHSQQKQPHDE